MAERVVVDVEVSWGRVELFRLGVGPPVVVLHRDLGPIGAGAMIDALADRFTVHLLALPGFGRSALPGWARSVSHVASLTGHVLDAAGLAGGALVGLGFGGWVAATLAASSPARVGSLALVSPMGLKPMSGEVVDQFLYSARGYGALSMGDATALDCALAEQPDDPDAYLDHSRETVTRVAWKPIGHDPALAGLLADVDKPALVVWGTDDAVVPSSTTMQWAACLRTDQVVTIEGGAHHVEFSHPAAVGAAISTFLHSLWVKRS